MGEARVHPATTRRHRPLVSCWPTMADPEIGLIDDVGHTYVPLSGGQRAADSAAPWPSGPARDSQVGVAPGRATRNRRGHHSLRRDGVLTGMARIAPGPVQVREAVAPGPSSSLGDASSVGLGTMPPSRGRTIWSRASNSTP